MSEAVVKKKHGKLSEIGQNVAEIAEQLLSDCVFGCGLERAQRRGRAVEQATGWSRGSRGQTGSSGGGEGAQR